MAAASNTGACRKCGEPNPISNQYCASCGAILQVSTAMMEAQPKAILPLYHSFQKRWFFISIFALLGFGAIGGLVVLVLSSFLWNASITAGGFGMTGLQTSAVQLMFLAMVVICVVFFAAGVLISRLAKDRKTAETALASIVVSVFIGISGTISGVVAGADFLIAALMLGVPGTVAVAFGARVGGKPFERKQS